MIPASGWSRWPLKPWGCHKGLCLSVRVEDTIILQTPSSHCHAAAQSGTREDATLPSKQVPSISHGLEEPELASHPHDTCGPPSHFWMVPHSMAVPAPHHSPRASQARGAVLELQMARPPAGKEPRDKGGCCLGSPCP